MAQVIKIPVAFEFRAGKVHWTIARARIIGWWKRDDGTVDGKHLVAQPWNSHRLLRFPSERLPWEVQNLCEDAFLEDSDDDERVGVYCSRFEPALLIASEWGYRTTQEVQAKCRPADAWQMRDDFLRMSADEESACEFLNAWGSWDNADYVELRDLIRLQKAVREGLISSPAKWFANHFRFPMLPARLSEYPFVAVVTNKCEEAITLTVSIDLLRRSKFKTCARRDCRLPFAITSRHQRRYCSQYCAHLESVRRNRRK